MRVNAQTIQALSQGKNPRTTDSIDFGWTLAIQLAKPHMERRRTVGGLSAYVQRCIDLLIGRAKHVAARPPQNPAAPRRCDLCVENLRDQPNYKKKTTCAKLHQGAIPVISQCVKCIIHLFVLIVHDK